MKRIFFLMGLSLGSIILPSLSAATGTLRPQVEKSQRATALPFFQAVPIAKGAITRSENLAVSLDGKAIPATVKPLVFWPDGSVRWLGVDGLWPADAPAESAVVTFEERKAESSPDALTLQENETRNALVLSTPDGKTLATLAPSAGVLPIDLPEAPQPSDADYGDREGQYSWAKPLGKLSSKPQVEALTPRILDSATEEDTPIYSVRVFRGDFGEKGVGHLLEWQFRAKIYRAAPILQTEMTWIVRWPAQKYVLASAKWKIIAPEPWKKFQLPDDSASGGASWGGIAWLFGDPAKNSAFGVRSDVDGSSVLLDGEEVSSPVTEPSILRNGLLAVGKQASLGVGIPNFTRLGPNQLLGRGDSVEIAMWDESSGKALDLRRSSGDLDFGIGAVDLKADGTGFSQTLRATLAFFPDADKSAAVAQNTMRRDNLWLANSEDLERTAALGSFQSESLKANAAYVEGLKANLLFLTRSRDHWKWNGLANFGDYRTNFALGKSQERQLTPLRWALNGRYGWRNNSADLVWALLSAGLFLDDREIALAGIDNALHVTEVDQMHGSLFKEEAGDEGGMHRRNRDHWSGEVHMQYSPSAGIYFSQWLTGDNRLRDGLKSLRSFARRDGGAVSPYAAQAWILRYMETHDSADLELASALLQRASQFWKDKAEGTPLKDAAMLFAKHTIRRESDGLPTVALFHEATGSPVYLQAMRDSLFFHKFDFGSTGIALDIQGLLGYLLAQGIVPTESERAFLETAVEATQKLAPVADWGDSSVLDYDALVDVVTKKLPPFGSPSYRESAAIGLRARFAFYALPWFGVGSKF